MAAPQTPNIITADVVRVALAAMKRQPYLGMYTGDWWKDPVSAASEAARCFWLTALFVMHDANVYGHLVGPSGKPMSDEQNLARFHIKTRAKLNQVRDELFELGVPGRVGDEDYQKILRTIPATITLRGIEWTLDLSPLGTYETGVIYSRRMLRDRRLALTRFLASPTGQALILPLMSCLRSGLTPQKSEVCTPPHARAGAEDEIEIGSLSQNRKEPEGVQGEGKPDFVAAAAIVAKLEASALRTKPSEQLVIAWCAKYGPALITETLADTEEDYRGKTWQYFAAILDARHGDPSQRPGNRRKKNANGRGDSHGSTEATRDRPRQTSADFGAVDARERLVRLRAEREMQEMRDADATGKTPVS